MLLIFLWTMELKPQQLFDNALLFLHAWYFEWVLSVISVHFVLVNIFTSPFPRALNHWDSIVWLNMIWAASPKECSSKTSSSFYSFFLGGIHQKDQYVCTAATCYNGRLTRYISCSHSALFVNTAYELLPCLTALISTSHSWKYSTHPIRFALPTAANTLTASSGSFPLGIVLKLTLVYGGIWML